MEKKILILGGSSSIAKELTILHNEDNVDFSYHSFVSYSDNAFYLDIYDIKSYQNIPNKQYDIIYSFLGFTPDISLIDDMNTSKVTMEKNFLYPTLILQFLLQNKRVTNKSKIKVVTSVAGIRGRKLNYVYGASKSGLQTLIEGLANKHTNIKFTDIILGPVFTDAVPLHNTPQILISTPVQAAKEIFKAKRQKTYVPFKWRIIMSIIQLIPNSIYNHLKL